MYSKHVYSFVDTSFTRKANSCIILCAHISHKKNAFMSLRPRAHTHFSMMSIHLCYMLVDCDYGGLHTSCFCGVLVTGFACSAKRRDSVSLTFATHIDFATRTRLQYQSPWLVGLGTRHDGHCWPCWSLLCGQP